MKKGILNTSGAVSTTGPLTKADLERAMGQIRDAPPPEPMCPPHLVSGTAHARVRDGGSARCVNCGGVLRLLNDELVVAAR